MSKKLLAGILLLSSTLTAQNFKRSDKVFASLKTDVENLADDKLEGRETGTIG